MITPVYTQLTCRQIPITDIPDGHGENCPLADGTYTADGSVRAC